MSEPALDPLKAIRALGRHEVRFVLIGGLGARLHGSPSITNDIDLCYERTMENLERLSSALRELQAHLRGAPAEVPFQLDPETLTLGDHFTFTTTAGSLDILGTPAGVDGFDELVRNAEMMQLGGIAVAVASIDDLIRMKRATGRRKDLIEVEVLGALRDEIADQERGAG